MNMIATHWLKRKLPQGKWKLPQQLQVARECAQSETGLKETEDQIATEQAAITARFAKIAEEQVARDAKRASDARYESYITFSPKAI